MSRIPRWKLEKTKVKVVFRLQFYASHVPQSGWDKLFISFIPLDTGKVAAKTNKTNVRNGSCKWADPIYETTRLLRDTRTKKYDDKLYKLVVSMGTSRSSLLGEVNINLADFSDALKPSSAALPLEGCEYGTVLHVTVQLLTSKTGFREFEQQREVGDKGHLSIYDPSVSNKGKFLFDSTALSSLQEVAEFNEDNEDAIAGFDCSSHTSESINTEKSDVTCTPDANSIKSTAYGQSRSPGKEDQANIHIHAKGNDVMHHWSPIYQKENGLTAACGDSESLRLVESSISEIGAEVSSLQNLADELNIEIKTIVKQLSNEITSGESLAREVSLLMSECLKIKTEMDELKHAKETLTISSAVTSNQETLPMHENIRDCSTNNKVSDSSVYFQDPMSPVVSKDGQTFSDTAVRELEIWSQADTKHPWLHTVQIQWLNDLPIVENKLKEIYSKAKLQQTGHDFDLLSDLVDLEAALLSLKRGISINNTVLEEAVVIDAQDSNSKKMQSLNSEDNLEGDANNMFEEREHELLTELENSKIEQENLVKKMRQMECYYVALVQELEDSHRSTTRELDSLRSEHSACYYTVSSFQIQMEKMHQDMNEQLLRFTEDRRNFDILNKELEKRAFASETMLNKIRQHYSTAVERLQTDLELLSSQVLSLFETNDNLAMEALTEASQCLFDESGGNSETASPNKKLHQYIISPISDRNMCSTELGLNQEMHTSKDFCGNELKTVSMQAPLKGNVQGRWSGELNSNVCPRSSLLCDCVPLNSVSTNDDESIEAVKRSFHVLQEHYLKAEAELSDMHVKMVSLDVFSNVLKEILCEKLGSISDMTKEFDGISQKLCNLGKSNELLEMKLQNAVDDCKELKHREATLITEHNSLMMRNHILESKLHHISDENSLLSERVAEFQALMRELNDLCVNYTDCCAYNLNPENLSTPENASRLSLEKEQNVILETNDATGIVNFKIFSHVNDLKKAVTFANEKLETLFLNFACHDMLLNTPVAVDHSPALDLMNNILHLEQLHESANKIIFKLCQEKKEVEEEKINIYASLRSQESCLQEQISKLNLSNDLIESLQLKLQCASENLNSSLEAEKFSAEKNKELSSKVAVLELELQRMIVENNQLAQRLCELDNINKDLEKTKLCLSSCMHEKETLMLSVQSRNDINVQLENEICHLKERIAFADGEILRRKFIEEKINATIKDLTVSLIEKQLLIDAQISQVVDLELQNTDLVSKTSELRHHIYKSEELKKKFEGENASLCSQISRLEYELLEVDENRRSLNLDLQEERGYRETSDCKIADLMQQLDEQSEQLCHYEKQKAELSHLHQQLLDLEAERNDLRLVLLESQEHNKNLNHKIFTFCSQVTDLESDLGSVNISLEAARDELNAERGKRDEMIAIVRDLKNELLQKDEQIQIGNDNEQKLNDSIRDLTCSLKENNTHINEQKDDIANLRQTISNLESQMYELQHRLTKCDELKRKVEGENSSLHAQFFVLENNLQELKEKLEVTNFQLQSERDSRDRLELRVDELIAGAQEKSQQLTCLESQNSELLHLKEHILELESEKAELQLTLSENQKHTENLNIEIARLYAQIIELESGLGDINGTLRISHDELHVEKGLRQQLEKVISHLQAELVVKDEQIVDLKENQQEIGHIQLQIANLEERNSEQHVLLLKEKETQKQLTYENSSLLIQLADLESQNREILEYAITKDIKLLFIKSQFSTVIKLLSGQLNVLDNSYEGHQLKYVDVKPTWQLIGENETLFSPLTLLNSGQDLMVSENLKLENSTNNRRVIPFQASGSAIEWSESEENCALNNEIKQLRHKQNSSDEEVDRLRFAKYELEITITVLTLKMNEQREYLSLLKEYDAELVKLREQHHELTYRLSEQILKTEEFKNLSIHLKELKNKADVEYFLTQEKKETDGPPMAVQETLRMAFIKEQCETKVQEMKNQLLASKKYGEELLMKLQNAVDEIEFRKKSEVSHLKRNEELSAKLMELEVQLERITSDREDLQNTYDKMKDNVECCNVNLDLCKDEKLKLELALRECNEERTKNRVELDLVRRRLEILSSSVEIFEKDHEPRSPNATSFGELLKVNKVGSSLDLQQPLAPRSIYLGKDTSSVVSPKAAKEKDNLMEIRYEVNDNMAKLSPPKFESTQDVLENHAGRGISGLGTTDQSNHLQLDVNLQEQIKERESLQSSLEMLQNELERLKNENLVSFVPLEEYHVDPDLSALRQELSKLDMANECLGNMFPSFLKFSTTGNVLENVLAFELELAEALQEKKKGIHLQSLFLKQHDDEEAMYKSFKDINELIREMLELKRRYAAVETELKEMQGRYSQLSLQFAEVEGERQKLTLTLKNRTPKMH